MKPPLSVADCVSVLVTTIFCAPAEPAGVVQVIDVDDTTVTLVHAAPPTVTVAPDKKFVPVIVINVPPAAVPDVPETLDTLGAAASGTITTGDDALEDPTELIALSMTEYEIPPVRPEIVIGEVASAGFGTTYVPPFSEYE